MTHAEFQIVRPSIQFQEPFLSYLQAFEVAGENYHSNTAEAARKDFPSYLDILERQARGIDNENGFNRELVYWLIDLDGQLIASARLRFPITDLVESTQGHIGLAVHPDFRRRGLASHLAGFLREEAMEMGMDHLTVLAAKTNTASRSLISKYGGVLMQEYPDPESGEEICRYRIDLKQD